jgi:hypothetical protein
MERSESFRAQRAPGEMDGNRQAAREKDGAQRVRIDADRARFVA